MSPSNSAISSLVLLISLSTICADFHSRRDAFNSIKSALNHYLWTGEASANLIKGLRKYQFPQIFREDSEITYASDEVCENCKTFAELAIAAHKAGVSPETFKARAVFLCKNMAIEPGPVCQGIMDLNTDIFLYILEHDPGNLTADRICGIYYQKDNCNFVASVWTIDIPEGSVQQAKSSANPEDTFNILHLSDMHYDPRYTPGSNNHCDEPVCCQDDSGKPDKKKHTCGYWTDYHNADVPWHLVTASVSQTTTHKFDFVYYTGDIISHRTWGTSLANNTRDIAKLYSFFADSYKVPVFPVFGNHEPHPFNQWVSDGVNSTTISTRWLYELAADYWSKLMKDASARSTILRGGYYTVSPRKGFRVVGMNSNFCYTSNYWLVFDDKDPMGQLQWLVGVLQKAEEDQESVHIITHVPTGAANCHKVWSHEYNRIVERFSHVITGQFNGHTHKDEMHVHYDSTNGTRAISAVFNGASITPFSKSNPSYKIFQVAKDAFTLEDYEEWTFNLTEANNKPTKKLNWYKLYSFRESYGTKNLYPSEIDQVLYRMARNHTLLDVYYRFSYRDGDAGIKKECDTQCQKNLLCQIATTDVKSDAPCNYFSKLYEEGK